MAISLAEHSVSINFVKSCEIATQLSFLVNLKNIDFPEVVKHPAQHTGRTSQSQSLQFANFCNTFPERNTVQTVNDFTSSTFAEFFGVAIIKAWDETKLDVSFFERFDEKRQSLRFCFSHFLRLFMRNLNHLIIQRTTSGGSFVAKQSDLMTICSQLLYNIKTNLSGTTAGKFSIKEKSDRCFYHT